MILSTLSWPRLPQLVAAGVAILLSFSASAYALPFKIYHQLPYDNTYTCDGVDWKANAVFSSQAEPGQYYVEGTQGGQYFGVFKTSPVGTGQTVQITAHTRAQDSLNPSWNYDEAYDIWISWTPVRVFRRPPGAPSDGSGDLEAEFSLSGEKSYTRQTIITPKPYPTAVTTPYVYEIRIGPAEDLCPPRHNILFDGLIEVNGVITTPHTAGLYIDGVLQGELMTIPAGKTPVSTINFDYTVPSTASGAFTWAFKWDGVTVKGGSFDCADEILGGKIMFNFVMPPDPPLPPENPDPDKPTPEPEKPKPNPDADKPGKEPDTTLPGGTNPSLPGVPTTGGAEGGAAAPQDIYKAVYAALMDAGNTGNLPGAPYTDGLDDMTSEGLKRGRLDEIEGQLKTIAADSEQLRGGIISGLDFSEKLNWLPKNNGSVTEIFLGNFTWKGQHVYRLALPIGQLQGSFNLIRSVFLIFLTIAFLWEVGRIVQEHFKA